MQLSKNFALTDLTVTTTGIPNVPNVSQIDRLMRTASCLEQVEQALGKKVVIDSAFRSLQVNQKVGGSPTSAHLDGDAVDFVVYGMTTRDICKAIIKAGIKFDQLIEEDKNGKQWVHISFAPATREQYLIFTKGKYLVGEKA